MNDYLLWSILWSILWFTAGYLVGLLRCELDQRRYYK